MLPFIVFIKYQKSKGVPMRRFSLCFLTLIIFTLFTGCIFDDEDDSEELTYVSNYGPEVVRNQSIKFTPTQGGSVDWFVLTCNGSGSVEGFNSNNTYGAESWIYTNPNLTVNYQTAARNISNF